MTKTQSGNKSDENIVLSVTNLQQTLEDKTLFSENMYYNNHNIPSVDSSSKAFTNKLISNKNPFLTNSFDSLALEQQSMAEGIAPGISSLLGAISDSDSKTVIDNEQSKDDDEKTADLHVIAHVSNLVSVQIDHYQLLFLLRLSEEMTELTTFLSLDSNRILQKVIYCVFFLEQHRYLLLIFIFL